MRFAVDGPSALESQDTDWESRFRMTEGDTLTGLLAQYDRVAQHDGGAHRHT